jgi:hypothetical protein
MTINIDNVILYGYSTKPGDDTTTPYPCDFPSCGDVIHVPYIALKDASAVIALVKQQHIDEGDDEPQIDLLCMCTSHMSDLRVMPNSIIGHPTIEFELRRLGVTR